jgi:RNA polymerase sigma-70 factor, ECF subfamily
MSTVGADLIQGMAAGDRDALARFYDRYAPLVYPLIRRILHDPAEVSACLHDVFWESWQRARAYDPARGTPESWVVTRARELAIERMRSTRRRREATPLGERASMPLAADGGERGLDRSVLTRVFERLPDPQRETLELAYYGGYSQSELATRLGVPLGTIKSRMFAGLARLREVLDEAESEGSWTPRLTS